MADTDADTSTDNIKIWRTSKDSKAGVMITDRAAFLIGTRTNFVVAGDTGVAIAGKSISLITSSENIRRAGLFVEMNDLVRMIPSTIMTPIPSQIPSPPLGMATGVLRDLPFFMAMLV